MALDRNVRVEAQFDTSGADEITKAEQTVRDFLRALERGDVVMKRSGASADDYDREVRELTQGLRAYVKESGRIRKTSGDWDQVAQKATSLKTIFKGLVAIDIASGIKQSLRAALDVIVEFSAGIAEAGAVLNASADGMAKLEAAARQMGATTSFSAGQAAQAQSELARAGLELEEVTARLPQVLALAKASKESLARSAQLATSAVKALQLDMSDLPRVLDVLTTASNNSSSTLPELVEALKKAGPAAASLKLPLEDTIALLGGFADASLRGGEGGTAFRAIAIRLSKETPKLNNTLRDLSLTFDDIDPKTNSLAQTLELLATKNLSVAQASELVGEEAATALLGLIGLAPKVADLRSKLDEADGSLDRFSKRMSDNLGAAINSAKSALSELALKAFRDSGLEAAAKDSLGGVVDLIKEIGPAATLVGKILTTLVVTVSGLIKSVTGGVGVIKGAVGGVVNLVLEGVSKVLGLVEKIPLLPKSVSDAMKEVRSVIDEGAKATDGSFRDMERAARRTSDGIVNGWGIIEDAWLGGSATARKQARAQAEALGEIDGILEGLVAAAKRTGPAAAEGVRGLGDAAQAEVARLRQAIASVGDDDPAARENLRKRMLAVSAAVREANPAVAAEISKMAEILEVPVDRLAEVQKRIEELGIGETLARIASAAADSAAQAAGGVEGFSVAVREELAALQGQLASLGDVDPAALEPLQAQLDQLVDDVAATNPAVAAEVARLAQALAIPADGLQISRNQVRDAMEQLVGDMDEAAKLLESRAPVLQAALRELVSQDLDLSEEERSKIAGMADKMVDALRTRLRELGGSVDLVSDADLEAFRGQMGQVIDIVRQAGTDLGTDLASIGEKLGFDVSGLRASTAEVDAALKEILGQVAGTREELEKEAAVWGEAVEQLSLQRINFELTDEQRAKLREKLQEIVDAARALGAQIEPAVADAAQALGIIIGAYERADNAARGFGTSAEEAAGRVPRLTRVTNEAGQSVLTMSTHAGEASKRVKGVGEAASSSAAGVETAAQKTKAAAAVFGEAATEVSAGNEALAGQTEKANEAADGLEQAGGAAEFVADSNRNMADSADAGAEALQKMLGQAQELERILTALAERPVRITLELVGQDDVLAGLAKVDAAATAARATIRGITEDAEAS